MRIGIDSYSYHRLLGEVRPGEDPPAGAFARGTADVLAHARALGVDLVSLETVFLAGPGELAAATADAGPTEVAVAWGHPDGLRWGDDAAALADLLAWIAAAPGAGVRLVRMVVASPRHPRAARGGSWWAPTVAALGAARTAAARAGVTLCVENHGDLRAQDLERLLDACPGLMVCFDTANALRVGDDPVHAARRLAARVAMVHLKDCAAGDGGDPVAGPVSVPYGTGVIDVRAVLEALARTPGNPAVCVELAQLPLGAVDERELVADAVAWLRAQDGRSAAGPAHDILRA